MTQKTTTRSAILAKIIEKRIFIIREHRVMIDSDLADLYGVKTKELNKAVKRNMERFPEEFIFHLTAAEYTTLRFQTGTSKNPRQGGRRYLPFVFTEQGVAMLSSVLNSPSAIQVNIIIIKTFVRLRQIIGENQEILKRLDALEKKTSVQDIKIDQVFRSIRELLGPLTQPKRRIGIRQSEE